MMEPSFEKLLVLLADERVDFVLVGGLAVTLQGYSKMRSRSMEWNCFRSPARLTPFLEMR